MNIGKKLTLFIVEFDKEFILEYQNLNNDFTYRQMCFNTKLCRRCNEETFVCIMKINVDYVMVVQNSTTLFIVNINGYKVHIHS